ncbi:bifunctional protein FolD 4, chloroplastic-like [Lotus japonicus]|uniref:bifunctional protein FolD 4, chloroplastic-like n=1 Tax=Lotus japonicus TaxID=34305 RepID=UPI002584F1EC|nr:bifunctional protein FolD 4, chloroplastic-like [Lotus japonicus]
MSSSIIQFHSSPLTDTVRLSRHSPCFLGLRSSPSSHVAAMATKACAKVIDVKAVAMQIRQDIKAEIYRMKEAVGVTPGLAVILVGDRNPIENYIVRDKKRACETVGINFLEVRLPEDSTENEILKHISLLNDDPSVHGNVFQIPLSRHMKKENLWKGVRIDKDVEGFHPFNIARLGTPIGEEPRFVPCTPLGCIELLHIYNVPISGKRAVVIGRRNDFVGLPAAHLLQREGARVSVVDSKTSNPEELTRQADIVISFAGRPNLVRRSWIKDGAVIIDAGASLAKDPNRPGGFRWVGDVCYEEAIKLASAMTPIHGGVGPMAMAMLLQNTLLSAKRMHNFE